MNHYYEHQNDISSYSTESPKIKSYNKLKKYYEQIEAQEKKNRNKFNQKGRNNNGNLYLKNTYQINNYISSNNSNLDFEGARNKENANKNALLKEIESNQSHWTKTVPDFKYIDPADIEHQKNLNLTPIPYLSDNNTFDENQKKEFYEIRKKIVNTRKMEYTHSFSSMPSEGKASNNNDEEYIVRNNLLNDKKKNNVTDKINSYNVWEDMVRKEKENYEIDFDVYDKISENKNQELSIKRESWNIISKKTKIFNDLLYQKCINMNIKNNKNENDDYNLYLINYCKPVNQCCFITKDIITKELNILIQKYNQININKFNNNDNNYLKVKKNDILNKFYASQKLIKTNSGKPYDRFLKNKLNISHDNNLINNIKDNSPKSIDNNDINMSYSNSNSDRNALFSFPDSLKSNNSIRPKKIFKKKYLHLNEKSNNNVVDSDSSYDYNDNNNSENRYLSLQTIKDNYNDIDDNKLKKLETILEKNNNKLNKEIFDNYNKKKEKMNHILKITKNKLPMKLVKIIKSHLKFIFKDIFQYNKIK